MNFSACNHFQNMHAFGYTDAFLLLSIQPKLLLELDLDNCFDGKILNKPNCKSFFHLPDYFLYSPFWQ